MGFSILDLNRSVKGEAATYEGQAATKVQYHSKVNATLCKIIVCRTAMLIILASCQLNRQESTHAF